MSTTPMRPAALLGADAAVNVSMMVVAIAVIAIVARLAFGVHLPAQGFGFVLTLVLTAGAMLSLGALVASVASTTRMRGWDVLFFPMLLAGLWVPQQQMSSGPSA